MKILNFEEYIKEQGYLDYEFTAPGYPRAITFDKDMPSSLIFEPHTNNHYTLDDYQDLHKKYLEKGGLPLLDFNLRNLQIVLGIQKDIRYK